MVGGGRGDPASRITCAPRPREGQLEGRLRQNRRPPTVESVSPSAQPLYTLVPALFTCSEKSDRVVCEIQAEGGARWRHVSHQHHHLHGQRGAHKGGTDALAASKTILQESTNDDRTSQLSDVMVVCDEWSKDLRQQKTPHSV